MAAEVNNVTDLVGITLSEHDSNFVVPVVIKIGDNDVVRPCEPVKVTKVGIGAMVDGIAVGNGGVVITGLSDEGRHSAIDIDKDGESGANVTAVIMSNGSLVMPKAKGDVAIG